MFERNYRHEFPVPENSLYCHRRPKIVAGKIEEKTVDGRRRRAAWY
ncbi:MAG: hypothetical protein H6940_10145 [Burkholderiales bacterium]|nr:hypothetical protein [Burkholderiales bacterium]